MLVCVEPTFDGVVASRDVAAASWLLSALRPWTARGIETVSTLVPSGFAAYARILHRSSSGNNEIRWVDIAARTGRAMDARSEFADLVGWQGDATHQSPPAPWREPDEGSLRPDECAAVAETLAAHTSTPGDCWFCVWEGYGWTGFGPNDGLPRVAFTHRNCVLFRGPVEAATAFRSPPWFQSPTWWWPQDRAWCVASELDIYSTYVAAARSAVGDLLQHPALEALECTEDQPVDRGRYGAFRSAPTDL